MSDQAKEAQRRLSRESKIEEAVGVLWIIAAILAFGFEHTFLGWVFAVKGTFDQCCSFGYSICRRILARKEKEN